MLQDPLDISERRACEIARQHRSTQRHEPKLAGDDQALRARLRELSAQRPRWGLPPSPREALRGGLVSQPQARAADLARGGTARAAAAQKAPAPR